MLLSIIFWGTSQQRDFIFFLMIFVWILKLYFSKQYKNILTFTGLQEMSSNAESFFWDSPCPFDFLHIHCTPIQPSFRGMRPSQRHRPGLSRVPLGLMLHSHCLEILNFSTRSPEFHSAERYQVCSWPVFTPLLALVSASFPLCPYVLCLWSFNFSSALQAILCPLGAHRKRLLKTLGGCNWSIKLNWKPCVPSSG